MTSDTKEHGEKVMKPCPFCGNENLREGQGDTYFIECEPCYDNFGTHVCAEGAARHDAVAMWNRRQRPSVTQDLAVRSATVDGLEQFAKFRKPAGDTSETLRNCDRCGHEAMFVEPGHRFHNGLYIQVECSNTSCGIRTPPHYKTREDAAKAWNRNALESAASATSGRAASAAKGKP